MSSVLEVEWDEQEQGWMLALGRYEDACCPNCGGYLPETTDIAMDEKYKATATRCHRCTAIGVEANRIKDNPQPHAVLFSTTKRG